MTIGQQHVVSTANANWKNIALKVGAGLWGLWGILHLWVGFEGFHLYLSSGAKGQWKMIIGGSKAPISAFSFPSDPTTAHVHSNLILNF